MLRGMKGKKQDPRHGRNPVAMRLRETPVLIPNTKVKPQAADGTILGTVWESRWLPDHKKILLLGYTGFTSDSKLGKS